MGIRLLLPRLAVLCVCLMLLAGPSVSASAVASERVSQAHELPATMVFSVEFNGECGPPVLPGKLSSLLLATPHEGMSLVSGGGAPLVSRENVIYSVLGTSGETSLPAAKIFAEVQGGGELTFKSDKGKHVVIQADLKSVCWDVDQAGALKLAKASRVPRVMIAVLRSEDVTADVNPDGGLGHQKSVVVALDLLVLEVESGRAIGAFSDESRQMDLSVASAVRRGVKALLPRAFADLSSKGLK